MPKKSYRPLHDLMHSLPGFSTKSMGQLFKEAAKKAKMTPEAFKKKWNAEAQIHPETGKKLKTGKGRPKPGTPMK